jgi:anti-sigma factor RsiW
MGQARGTSESRKHTRHAKTIALDVDREASMADEGGVSAALLELEEPEERKARLPGAPKRRGAVPWLVGGLLGIAAFAAFGWLRRV